MKTAVTVFALAAALSLAASASASDWPQFLGPTRDGVSPETNLLSSWPKEGPKVLWKTNVGQGWSGPVVASNRVIVFHRVDDKEVVDCLVAATGSARWHSEYASDYRDDFG